MNYELAKKLKEAGFPQAAEWSRGFWDYPTRVDRYADFEWSAEHAEKFKDGYVYVPTLSELITEVARFGLEFGEGMPAYRLELSGGQVEKSRWWTASFADSSYGDYVKKWSGETPEEAVANLWLILRQKK